MDQMIDGSSIKCNIVIETIYANGKVANRVNSKDSVGSLCRNEFREIHLNISSKKASFSFQLNKVRIYKRFASSGKASIVINTTTQIYISDCPPSTLISFLKLLCFKSTCQIEKGMYTPREKAMSNRPKHFQKISPLTNDDLETTNKIRTQQTNCSSSDGRKDETTPKMKSKKFKQLSDVTNLRKSPRSMVKKSSLFSRSVLKLTTEQNLVLKSVLDGKNIFFTGSAGTGKSFLLQHIIRAFPPNSTFATATTGIAACHIGGITINAFSGIGSGNGTIEHCINMASRPVYKRQWKQCKLLIIDEISMLSGEMFKKLEIVARIVRNNEMSFGGIQLVCSGDFFQLPPISKNRETNNREFCFEVAAWNKVIEVCFELTEVKRQTDKSFVNLLNNLRYGRCTPSMTTTLQATAKNQIESGSILATKLYSHNEDVSTINSRELESLSGISNSYTSIDSDPNLKTYMDSHCMAPATLKLKVGTQVMLTKNIDVGKGLVNGARGVLLCFVGKSNFPKVTFITGVEEVIRPERFLVKSSSNVCLVRQQIPLKLAWAISIHKSQGMTIDSVEMSLLRVFEYGQAYVALSRAKSLHSLRVVDFDPVCIKADPKVLKFYASMRALMN